MNMITRREYDSIGYMEVPSDAYYGVQTLRAKENFRITALPMHPTFIKNIVLIKKAAAITNRDGGFLTTRVADAIIAACDEIIAGKLRGQFVVDAIQGGAGTSANMNANEVIANRAIELLGGQKGDYTIVHPNDHVNMSQSTNDVIPSAGKMTVIELMTGLTRELTRLDNMLSQKAAEFAHVLKLGRTQLQDAVPMRLGQTFRSYSSALRRDLLSKSFLVKLLGGLNLGGTAIGSAINTTPYYLAHIMENLNAVSGMRLRTAYDLFDSTQNLDGFVRVSATLKACAVTLSKMCNDLRLLSSGPRGGLGEINLPPRQNGSSIMPGKVNPVIPEVVSQVAYQVIGNDVTITMAAEAGQLELNAFEPVLFRNLFESIDCMRGAVQTLVDNCLSGITANEDRCLEHLERSCCMATALSPVIGYKRAADIAKEALRTGKTVRELAQKENIPQAELDHLLDPARSTDPCIAPESELFDQMMRLMNEEAKTE